MYICSHVAPWAGAGVEAEFSEPHWRPLTVSAAEHPVLGASLGTGRRDVAFREMLQLLLPGDAAGLQRMFCSTDLPSGVITLSKKKKKGKSMVIWREISVQPSVPVLKTEG